MAFDPYKNSHEAVLGNTPVPESTWAPLNNEPIMLDNGSGNPVTRDILERTLPYQNGESEYLMKRQLAAINKR